MRAVLQRVRWAKVTVAGEVVGEIGPGVLVLLGAGRGDTEEVAAAMAKKTAQLRIFEDDDAKMNRALVDCGGQCLVVSQFTLFADCRKGRRPFFGNAEDPERATALCDHFADAMRHHGVKTETGRFGAMMDVELLNDGPVTIILDSEELARSRRG